MRNIVIKDIMNKISLHRKKLEEDSSKLYDSLNSKKKKIVIVLGIYSLITSLIVILLILLYHRKVKDVDGYKQHSFSRWFKDQTISIIVYLLEHRIKQLIKKD